MVTGELSSVVLVTPLWTRDGGIGTHVMASAEALAQRGCDVHVLAARLDSDIRVAGVTLHDSPRLLDTSASIQTRVGAALARIPAAVHLHQLHDPELVAHMQRSAPLVISPRTTAAETLASSARAGTLRAKPSAATASTRARDAVILAGGGPPLT